MPRFTDIKNLPDGLKHNPIPDLIAEAKSLIESRGYSQSTVWHYNERFNDLQRNAATFNTTKLSKEFITRFIEEGRHRSPKLTCSSVQRKSLLNLIATAVGGSIVFAFENEADKIKTQVLRETLAAYELHLIGQDKRKETITSYLQTATNFLLYLEGIKKTTLPEVSATDIRGFIAELSAKWSPRSIRIVPSQLKTYLKFAGFNADAILFSSLRAPRRSKPVRAMSNENVEALWKYVEGDAGDLRSKAIVALMLATGMRPVDITGLKLDDIDWHSDNIGFVQSKTSEYMNIELFPAIGSAIVRYIMEESNNGSGVKYVFLSKKAPHRRLSPSTCNRILHNALEKAGIVFVADGLHCPRAIRRSLVSRMVAKGIPVQKAAASIGHVDEKSVDLYTELDVEKMRSICLPIPTSMRGWLQAND